MTFDRLVVELHLQRISAHYVVFVYIPSALLVLLASLLFWLPPGALAERTSYSAFLFLGMVLITAASQYGIPQARRKHSPKTQIRHKVFTEILSGWLPEVDRHLVWLVSRFPVRCDHRSAHLAHPASASARSRSQRFPTDGANISQTINSDSML